MTQTEMLLIAVSSLAAVISAIFGLLMRSKDKQLEQQKEQYEARLADKNKHIESLTKDLAEERDDNDQLIDKVEKLLNKNHSDVDRRSRSHKCKSDLESFTHDINMSTDEIKAIIAKARS